MAHEPKFQQGPKGVTVEPMPQQQSDGDCCHQTMELRIHTPYRWQQVTSTVGVDIPPQSEADMMAFISNTAQAFEAAGYRIQAHSLVDKGAGWIFFVTIGWDECVPCEPMQPPIG